MAAKGAPGPKKSAAGARKPAAPARPRVSIRMYNTGFGDCFLLRFPGEDRPLKVLIDCGKHSLSPNGPPLRSIVDQVLKDLEEGEKDGPRADVVVATHRHLDHVNGFRYDDWDGVTVGEVWMPWTEHPEDPEARRICDSQARRALQLQEAVIPGSPFLLRMKEEKDRATYLEHMLGYAGNNLKNEKAMNRLHRGFRGNPKRFFLPRRDWRRPARAVQKGEDDRVVPTDRLPGVEVYALGPSWSDETIRAMDPPPEESYFRAADGRTAPAPAPAPPPPASLFDARWAMSREVYQAWYKQHECPDDPLSGFPPETESHLAEVLDDPAGELAATLEASVNGTSLVLLFKVGRAVLLFPGDAQWGTWDEILGDPRWHSLLKQVSFYKVGHHGSHNATPRRFVVDYLPEGAFAMIPTDVVPKWPEIPKPALLKGLAGKGVGYVRSDQALSGGDPKAFTRTLAAPGGDTLFVDFDLDC